MNVVVDSSAWIEWLTDSATGRELASSMPSPENCVVPTIVQFEVVKWLRRKADDDQADAFLAFTMECQVEPLDTEIAILSVTISSDHKLAMADAIVLATARKAGATLLTCDAHFEGVPGVRYLKKNTH